VCVCVCVCRQLDARDEINRKARDPIDKRTDLPSERETERERQRERERRRTDENETEKEKENLKILLLQLVTRYVNCLKRSIHLWWSCFHHRQT
jgi:hypothetical protein